MRRRAILTAILLTVPAVAGAAASTPREIVEQVYRDAGGEGGWDELFAQSMGRKRPWSRELRMVVRAADAKTQKTGERWLDFDPVSNSQDPSVHDLKIGVASEGGGKTSIRAEFRFGAEADSSASRVFYDFVFEDGSWTLDNIRGSIVGEKDSGWSLKKIARDAAPARRR